MFYTTAHTSPLSVRPFFFCTNCDLMHLNEPLEQPQSANFSEVCTNDSCIAEQHQSQSPVFTFSVSFFSFFHSDLLYLQGKGGSHVAGCELGCCRIRKCPSVFRKMLMIDSKCWDSQE